jgi:hypothetical protein
MESPHTNREITTMEDGERLKLGAWIKQVQGFKAGALGYAVVALTLVATGYFAFTPELFFPSGRYPKVVLVLPGLAIGAMVFFTACALTWLVRRARP